MSTNYNLINGQIGVWSCVGYLALVLGGWMLSLGLFPAPSPALSAEDIQAIFQANTNLIRLGTMLMMTGFALNIPWVAAITTIMRRMEGANPILSYTQLGAGASYFFILSLWATLLTVAAFRPDRDPALIQVIHDLAWIMFIWTFSPFFVQLMSIGIATLQDQNESVFPRWVGYFNIWVAILFLPGPMATFFKTGPFAWNGLLAFWLVFIVYFGWYIVMAIVMWKTTRKVWG